MIQVTPANINQRMDELLDDEVDAVMLTGSSARKQALAYSDLDYKRFFLQSRELSHQYLCRNDRLLSVTDVDYDTVERQLAHPEECLWAAPGLIQGKILLDRGGRLARLVERANALPAAHPLARLWAAEHYHGWSEEVHKLLNALGHDEREMAVAPCWGLLEGLTRVVAVALRVAIPTENRYFSTVARATGDSRWAGLQTRLWHDELNWRERCRLALQLFVETQTLLDFPPDPVVTQTLRKISESIDVPGTEAAYP